MIEKLRWCIDDLLLVNKIPKQRECLLEMNDTLITPSKHDLSILKSDRDVSRWVANESNDRMSVDGFQISTEGSV